MRQSTQKAMFMVKTHPFPKFISFRSFGLCLKILKQVVQYQKEE